MNRAKTLKTGKFVATGTVSHLFCFGTFAYVLQQPFSSRLGAEGPTIELSRATNYILTVDLAGEKQLSSSENGTRESKPWTEF